jgi:hypothetical protein
VVYISLSLKNVRNSCREYSVWNCSKLLRGHKVCTLCFDRHCSALKSRYIVSGPFLRPFEVHSVNTGRKWCYNMRGSFSIRERINWWVIYENYSQKNHVLACEYCVKPVIWRDRVYNKLYSCNIHQ